MTVNELIEQLKDYPGDSMVVIPEVYDLRTENKQLKEAIRRLADQDATLSVQGGNVIVEMDSTLTLAERTVLEVCANHWLAAPAHGVLCGLLKRMR